MLVLDDNAPLASWLERELARTGVTTVVAPTAEMARGGVPQPIHLAIVDLLLPDGDGLSVASSSSCACGRGCGWS